MIPWAKPTQPIYSISVGSAVFAGLMNVTNRHTDKRADRQTDHATPCVTVGPVY